MNILMCPCIHVIVPISDVFIIIIACSKRKTNYFKTFVCFPSVLQENQKNCDMWIDSYS